MGRDKREINLTFGFLRKKEEIGRLPLESDFVDIFF